MSDVSRRIALLWEELEDTPPEVVRVPDEPPVIIHTDDEGEDHLLEDGPWEPSEGDDGIRVGPDEVLSVTGDLLIGTTEDPGTDFRVDSDVIHLRARQTVIHNAEHILDLPCTDPLRQGTFVTLDSDGDLCDVTDLPNGPVIGMMVDWEAGIGQVLTRGRVQTVVPLGNNVTGFRIYLDPSSGFLYPGGPGLPRREDSVLVGIALSPNELLLRMP